MAITTLGGMGEVGLSALKNALTDSMLLLSGSGCYQKLVYPTWTNLFLTIYIFNSCFTSGMRY